MYFVSKSTLRSLPVYSTLVGLGVVVSCAAPWSPSWSRFVDAASVPFGPILVAVPAFCCVFAAHYSAKRAAATAAMTVCVLLATTTAEATGTGGLLGPQSQRNFVLLVVAGVWACVGHVIALETRMGGRWAAAAVLGSILLGQAGSWMMPDPTVAALVAALVAGAFVETDKKRRRFVQVAGVWFLCFVGAAVWRHTDRYSEPAVSYAGVSTTVVLLIVSMTLVAERHRDQEQSAGSSSK